MKQKKLHITLLLILIWSFCFSQQFINYTTKDGLPSNHVYKMHQDANGFIWVATDKGLVKFNGTEFKTFTTKEGLATNDVWGLNATPDGKIWFQSKAPKVGFIENDSVHVFESNIKGEVFDSSFTSQIDNTIILQSPTKAHQLVDGVFKRYISNKSRDKFYDNFVKHKTIPKFEVNEKTDSLILYNKKDEVVKLLNISNILTKTHKRGQLTDSLLYWVSESKYSIFNLNTLKLTERFLKEEIGLEKSKYARINIINNQLQISGRGFVGILDKDLKITNVYKFPQHLNAHFGIIDKTGNVWLSTFTNGFYKLPMHNKNVKYTLNDKKITSITKVGDQLYATSYNDGYYVFDGYIKQFKKTFTNKQFLYEPNYLPAFNTTIFASENSYFKLKNRDTISVIFRLKGEIKTRITIKKILSLNKRTFIQNSFGISEVDFIDTSIIKQHPQIGINDILNFNNTLFIATTTGLKVFKDEKIKPVMFQNRELTNSILKINNISNNQLLLNTDGFGAYITDLKIIRQLPNSEFLIVNNAYVEEDTIWLATNKGVLQYRKQDKFYVFINHIDAKNGLPENNATDVYVKGNEVFVSTNKGIAILPKEQLTNNQLLDVYLNSANYNSETVSQNSSFIYKKNNNLNFEVTTIDYTDATDDFSYDYKLSPVQNKWTTTTSKNISFNGLQPNSYIFNYRVDTIQKQIGFSIKPLWWQTLWFKLLSGLLAIVIIAYVSRILIKRSEFKKNQKLIEEKRISDIQLKALRSQMNPHFVFNSLAAIQYYINNNEIKASETYLVKFSKLVRQFFELSKETEINVNEEIKLIKNYLDIEKLRFKEKFEYKINVDSNLDVNQSKLPTMLLQPIVENAVNHGVFNKIEDGNITVNFISENKKSIKVEIIDDGVGFVNTKKKSKRKVKSSNVLEDRLGFLNQTGLWDISYSEEELHPKLNDKGNKSTFIITQL